MSTIRVEPIPFRDDAEILALVRDFESGALARERWTHAAHLTVALWYVRRFKWEMAVSVMRARIKLYNARHGIADTPRSGYHETITLFWLRAVRDFLDAHRSSPERGLAALANEMIRALGDKKLPLKFYTRERLMSAEARAVYVAPDLATAQRPRSPAARITAAGAAAVTATTARAESRGACASARRGWRERRRV